MMVAPVISEKRRCRGTLHWPPVGGGERSKREGEQVVKRGPTSIGAPANISISNFSHKQGITTVT
jgi:hypothetical protein